MIVQFGDTRLPQRFWDKVLPEPNSGCWLWTAACAPNGYGVFRSGKTRNAHRFAFFALVGPVPANLELDHLCRVRCCVNCAHLEPVTKAVNVSRGTAVPPVRRGQSHYRVTVSDDLVRQALDACAAGESQKRVAARLGIGESTVSRWIRGVSRQLTAPKLVVDADAINAQLKAGGE